MSTGKQINWCRWGYLAAALVAGAVLAGAPGTARAAVPAGMIVDGVLTSSGGGAAADGTYTVTFGLHATEVGGNPVWTEGPVQLVVKNGSFDYALGSTKPIDAAALAALNPPWLSITIENNPALARVPLHAVAYSLRAAAAEALSCTGCLQAKHLGKGAVTTDALADGAVTDAQLAVNYAGSDSKGGAAKSLACTGCIKAGHIDTKAQLTVASVATDAAVLNGLGVSGAATVGGQAICTEAGNCKTTLDKLQCKAGELMVWNGSAWACSAPPASGVTMESLGCKAGEAPTFNGSAWGCKAVVNQLTALNCSANQIPVKQADGSWACGSVPAATTPQAPCTGAFEALRWDGKAWKCVNVLGTGLSKGKYNGFEVVDDWGDAWDGMERGTYTWLDAKNLCESLGGRLPTATELYRVSAIKTGQVGGSAAGNWLWTLNPRATNDAILVRLSDGNRTNAGTGGKYNVRCVWPDAKPANFSANNCYGPKGNTCYKLKTEGKRFVMDMYERAPIPKSSAEWECNFYYAHLSPYLSYIEGAQSGVPNGSNDWLHTGDDHRYEWDTLIRWSGTNPAYNPDGNTTYSGQLDYRPFRCVGVGYDAGTHPVELPNKAEYVAKNYLKFDDKDRVSDFWYKAIQTCWNAGGHLPRSGDMTETIAGGMPNGTNAWLWSSDLDGYHSYPWAYVMLYRFTAANGAWFGHFYSDFVTHTHVDPSNNKQAYRCLYYPVDKDYAGPDSNNDCAGGCQEFKLPGNSGAKVWVDKFDRVGTTMGSAVNICLSKGGHLLHMRDYAELIHNGLVNGTNNWLWTWDVGHGNQGMYVHLARWSGNGVSNWTMHHSNTWTWASWSNTYSYRCLWTNELRH